MKESFFILSSFFQYPGVNCAAQAITRLFRWQEVSGFLIYNDGIRSVHPPLSMAKQSIGLTLFRQFCYTYNAWNLNVFLLAVQRSRSSRYWDTVGPLAGLHQAAAPRRRTGWKRMLTNGSRRDKAAGNE